MHQTSSFAVLSAIGSVAAAAGALPRGVGPDFASHYSSKTEFSCISNPSVKISFDRVNDNSCDCPDGSDEPGTAACAHIDPLSPGQPLPGSSSGTTQAKNALPGFWCQNKGHIGAYVPFIYVNDGICDYELCCDGSEEYAKVGGVKCANKCGEIGKEFRRLKEEKRKKAESASQQKQDLITKAKSLREECQTRIVQLERDIRRLESQQVQLEKQYADAQRQDRTRAVKAEGAGGKIGVLLSQAKSRVSELRLALDTAVSDRIKVAAQVQELETILRKFKEEYNPNFNDEGVKAAVKSFEDYAAREGSIGDQVYDDHASVLEEDSTTSGVNWAEFESEDSDTDIIYNFEAYLPKFIREPIHEFIIGSRLWLMENGILADNSDASTESATARTAREARDSAERDLNDKKDKLSGEKEELKRDFGPSEIFRALSNQCIEIDSGEYTYEHCWLDKTMQKSKKGHGHTNMGNFKRIDRETADDEERLDGKSLGKGERMVLRYEDGQACWNGPNRRTDVWLGCSDKEEVWRVTEAEKCVYKMEVGTPAACQDVAPQDQDVKDEL